MTRDATKFTESCRTSDNAGRPSVELQADAWARAACAFVMQTRALRKLHPGGTRSVKKELFLLGRSINATLKEEHMAMQKYSVTVPMAKEILEKTRKAVAELQALQALLEKAPLAKDVGST